MIEVPPFPRFSVSPIPVVVVLPTPFPPNYPCVISPQFRLFSMHELPATRGILAIALDTARETRAQRITAIDIHVGELTSIVDDSVQFYFDILSKDTPAAGATLNFKREPGTGLCTNCSKSFAVRPPLDPECPHCKAFAVRVSGGNRFFVESIEVEE